ncbi:hypothetical protein EVAR_17453_1 [Eumeta japonica]|uniref:Uncharacterized protein n=1 Tax=Eumeta variegata TaxID=151549 RepID=A0A4C1V9X3_EUMVA|nr:hypothetical protein EVAR_17453_1 [Eumeta japonica]
MGAWSTSGRQVAVSASFAGHYTFLSAAGADVAAVFVRHSTRRRQARGEVYDQCSAAFESVTGARHNEMYLLACYNAIGVHVELSVLGYINNVNSIYTARFDDSCAEVRGATGTGGAAMRCAGAGVLRLSKVESSSNENRQPPAVENVTLTR